ncbi:transposase [Catenibacterium sp.]|uniref:transposase n=1 Tax=Catenibacterium sp. TaxID=2049022 RepID=UPI0039969B4D
MKEVLESDIIEDEKILKCIHGSCKNKDKILDSIKHCNIETDQRFKMNESMTHMEELQVHINNCEIEIMKRANTNVRSIHGTSPNYQVSALYLAILIISEIGVDMKQFESDKQLACWAGLAPANNESANKKKSVRISKAGQYLKPLLVQCALGAIKDKEGYFGIKLFSYQKRRGHKKAIIAIARMMLVSIYHMILLERHLILQIMNHLKILSHL